MEKLFYNVIKVDKKFVITFLFVFEINLSNTRKMIPVKEQAFFNSEDISCLTNSSYIKTVPDQAVVILQLGWSVRNQEIQQPHAGKETNHKNKI